MSSRGLRYVLRAASLGPLVLLLLSSWGVRAPLAGAPAQSAVAVTAPEHKPATRWVGTNSCAASGCHGGNNALGDDRSAYTIWMALDPHAWAGSVLLEEQSQDIEDRLGASAPGGRVSATADTRCLVCHAPQADVGLERGALRGSTRDGVGCESCHGAAGAWLEPHSLAEWKSRSEEAKRAAGMNVITGLSARAETCVACHVGGPGHDVGHDLIAAGHPRLNFEFQSYLDALPPHWDSAKERRETPDFRARAWAIGQAVSARSALQLLSSRAGEAAREKGSGARQPWPEFAEYDCASCHHNLTEPAWSQGRVASANAPGSLRWGTWYYPAASALAKGLGLVAPDAPRNSMAELHRQMATSNPDPALIAATAAQAELFASWLGRDLRTATFPDNTFANLIGSLLDDSELRNDGWDPSAQLCLALVAWEHSLKDRGKDRPAGASEDLRELVRLLDPESSEETMSHPGEGNVRKVDEVLARLRERIGHRSRRE